MGVGVSVRKKMQTMRQTLVTLCRSALEGAQVLGCKNVVLYSIDWGAVWLSTAAAVLIVEELFQFCPSFLLFALNMYLYKRQQRPPLLQ